MAGLKQDKIIGDAVTGSVWVGFSELDPKASQELVNHSPDGFSWGYGGSGPAQLALAILLHFDLKRKWALEWYQDFKREVIVGLDQYKSFEIPIDTVLEWIDNRKAAAGDQGGMQDKVFLQNCRAIFDELLKNASHGFGINFGRLNDTGIEVNRRLAEMEESE